MTDFNEVKKRLEEITEWLRHEYSAIRTGRATPTVLDSVKVDAYGTQMKVPQVATVTIEGTKSLFVAPWDKGLMGAVEAAIRDAGLGLSVATDDKGVRVTFPELTEETRTSLLKILNKKHEEARVSVRSERERVREEIKNDESINEDQERKLLEELQKIVDEKNKELEEMAKHKEAEIKGEV